MRPRRFREALSSLPPPIPGAMAALAALEVVKDWIEEDLHELFVPMMRDLFILQTVARSANIRSRLCRISNKYKVDVNNQIDVLEMLAYREEKIVEELTARESPRWLHYYLLSDLEDHLNEYYTVEGGNHDMRGYTTLRLKARYESVHLEIVELCEWFGVDGDHVMVNPPLRLRSLGRLQVSGA